MAAPVNDNIANAIALGAGTTQVTGNNTEATTEVGEFRGTGTPAKTVWYRWVGSTNGSVQIDTVGSAFDTFLTIFKVSANLSETVTNPGNLTTVGYDDDTGGSGTSRATFTAQQGRVYYIQISGYNSTYFGNYVLNYPSPGTEYVLGNDSLANATVLAEGTTSITGNTTNATSETGELKGTANGTGTVTAAGFRTVWFRWRAPDSIPGAMTFTTAGSDLDTYLTMWKAKAGVTDPVTAVTDLDILASNDDGGGGGNSSITFTPTASTDYYFQVTGYQSDKYGWYKFNYPSPGASGTSHSGSATLAGTAALTAAAAKTTAGTAALAATGALDAAGSGSVTASATLAAAGALATAVALDTAASATLDATAELTAAGDVASANPTLSSVVDNFDDDTATNPPWAANYGGVSEVGGRARVPCSTVSYAGYQTDTIYVFDRVLVQVPVIAALEGATGECYTSMWVISASEEAGTHVGFLCDRISGMLYPSNRVGYSDGSAPALPIDEVDHAWWRLRLDGTDLVWETAPDGADWTVQRTSAAPSWLLTATDCKLLLESHRASGTNNYSEFDNLNSPPPQTATATFAATAGLSGAAELAQPASASMSATGALTGDAALTVPAAATFAATGSLAAAGALGLSTAATFNAAASLAATGERTAGGTATLGSTGNLTADATLTRQGEATLPGTASLTAVGVSALPGAATFDASAALTGTAVLIRDTASVLAATGALSASGAVQGEGGQADLEATASLTATATSAGTATAALPATGTLTALPERTTFAAATFGATAELEAAADILGAQTTTLAGAGTLSAAGTVERVTLTTLAGVAALTAAATAEGAGGGALTAVGALSATGAVSRSASATFAATAALSAATVTARRPGMLTAGTARPRLTAGTTRSRLTAATSRGPTLSGG
jgi:hypothetical protein